MVKSKKLQRYYLIHMLSVSLSLLTCAVAMGEQLFYDGFKSGDLTNGGWFVSDAVAQTAHKKTDAHRIELNNISSISKALSTTGYSDISISYIWRTRSFGSDDHFYSEWYDGNTWIIIEDINKTKRLWSSSSFTLPSAANNNANFHVRFRTTCVGNSGSAYLDDIKIEGVRQRDSITVGTTVINTVKPLLLASNIEWVDDGQHVHLHTSNTFHRDSITVLNDIGLKNLRYPGGSHSDYFHWNEAIGRNRKKQKQAFGANTQYPYFGPAEYAEFCKNEMGGVSQTITLNAGTGTAQEAADWVAYCNRTAQNVEHFCIGNEIHMIGDNKDPAYKTPAQYRDFWLSCYNAIQKAVPGTRVGAIGGADLPGALLKFTVDPAWLDIVIPGIKDKMAFLDVHNAYAPVVRFNWPTMTDRNNDADFAQTFIGEATCVRANLDLVYSKMKVLAGEYWNNIDITITEGGPLIYNLDPDNEVDDLAWNTTLVAALYHATLLNMLARDPKVVQFNNMPMYQNYFAALVGVDVTRDPRALWKNINYYAVQEFANMAARNVLSVEVQCGSYDSPAVGGMAPLVNVPYLDVGAYKNPSSEEITLFIINRDLSNNRDVIIVPGYEAYTISQIKTLTSSSYMDRNTASAPNHVVLNSDAGVPYHCNAPYQMMLPKHSLVIMTIRKHMTFNAVCRNL